MEPVGEIENIMVRFQCMGDDPKCPAGDRIFKSYGCAFVIF